MKEQRRQGRAMTRAQQHGPVIFFFPPEKDRGGSAGAAGAPFEHPLFHCGLPQSEQPLA